MANKNVILTDKEGEQLNPATTAAQIDYNGEVNAEQQLKIIEGVIEQYE